MKLFPALWRRTVIISTAAICLSAFASLNVVYSSRLADYSTAVIGFNTLINNPKAVQEQTLLNSCLNTPDSDIRGCLLHIAPQLNDWQTTRRAARALTAGVSNYPDDPDARKVAIGLMDRAWTSWYKDYRPAAAAIDKAANRANSLDIFYWGEPRLPGTESTLLKATQSLDIAVLSPEEARRIQKRRLAHPEELNLL